VEVYGAGTNEGRDCVRVAKDGCTWNAEVGVHGEFSCGEHPGMSIYWLMVRLGIDNIIRTISTYFVVFSETTNAAKYACKISTIPSIPSLN
jgi:hypothetical protein